MATVYLPATLVELFPGAPRQVEAEGGTVREVIDRLDERWPGMRSRLCDTPATLRRHLAIFVDSSQSDLATRVEPGAQVRIIPALSGG
jgi:molybdopterin converting factor small subunit